jgi:hypothetical protein
MTAAAGGLVLQVVERPAASDAFVRLPWAIYRDDPAWVPPLLLERREHLDPRKNPFFETAATRFWLALRDGRPVGRISAQVNRAYLAKHGDATGHFGMLEAEDDPAIFRALLGAAEDWLKGQGMRRALGPFNLSINEECGLLIEGFEHPPSMLMGHAKPYYAARLEALGYRKAKDLICYRYDATSEMPPAVAHLLGKTARGERLKVRALDFSRYEADLATIMEIFNDAWADNWGFVPMSQAELRHMAKALKPIVRSQSVAIAELDGKPVAMAIGLPNVNEVIADLDAEDRAGAADGRAQGLSRLPAGGGAGDRGDRADLAGTDGDGRHGRRAVLDPGGQSCHATHDRAVRRCRLQDLSHL